MRRADGMLCDDVLHLIFQHSNYEVAMVNRRWRDSHRRFLEDEYEDRLVELLRAMRIDSSAITPGLKKKWMLRLHAHPSRLLPVLRCARCLGPVGEVGVCGCGPTPPFPWLRALAGPMVLAVVCVKLLRHG